MPNIPGQNLLNMALTVIARQTLNYYRDGGRTLNSVGQEITNFALPLLLVGSWQPVPKTRYEAYGLDLQKEYYTFYTSNDALDLQRDVSGDQIGFDGKRFQVESANDWFRLDGWKGVLCCYIGPDVDEPQIWGFGTPYGITPRNSYVNFGQGNFRGAQND